MGEPANNLLGQWVRDIVTGKRGPVRAVAFADGRFTVIFQHRVNAYDYDNAELVTTSAFELTKGWQ